MGRGSVGSNDPTFQTRRYLWVSDGTHSHATVLPSSASILDALANYADDHVTAGGKQQVTYQMWQNGVMMVSGNHSFKASV
jgi:hypothetical protein